MSSLLVRTLIDVPRIIANTETIQRKTWNKIHKICYANNEEFWACRADQIISLYNFYGELVKSIQSKTGNITIDIAVTKSGI